MKTSINFLKTLVLLSSLVIFQFGSFAQTSGYVTVDCNDFNLNGLHYRPLVINYMIDFANANSGCTVNYASPLWNYSAQWVGAGPNGMPCVNPYGYTGRTGYEGAGYPEMPTAQSKLANDLRKIQLMGFNTIRTFTERNYHSSIGFYYRTGSLNGDLLVVDNLLQAVVIHNSTYNDNMKVILNLGVSASCGATCGVGEWDDYTGYRNYLETFANRYKNNQELMAYDLYNEPDQSPWSPYHYNSSLPNDKYKISNWITEWYYSVKKFDPNHLVTIGLSHSDFTPGWDPNMMPVDFISLHYYATTKVVATAEIQIGSYLYYAAKNITKPWIIGETSYSGTNVSISDPNIGTESDQRAYAAFTLQNSVDCGCKGYSWWQYQEAGWGPYNQYMGLVKQYASVSSNVEGTDKSIITGVTPPFTTYAGMTPNASACVAPSGGTFTYYNLMGQPATSWTGIVKDDAGLALQNAYVLAMTSAGEMKTFTDATGFFRIYAPSCSFYSFRISKPGYSTVLPLGIPSGGTYNLWKVNYNNWTKKWTNSGNNYIGSWGMSDPDGIINWDYDGDGKEDLLCVKNTSLTNDWATILKYDNLAANWVQEWTNSGGDWIGSWHQQTGQYNDRYLAGDFDADGKDELLSMQVFGSGDWCTMQKYNAGSWSNVITNSGSDYIGPWKIETTDEFKVGDFNSDGKDDLFCIRKTSGNADLFSILNYNAGVWNYLVIAGNTITNWSSDWMGSWKINPIDKYYIGDFNGDGRDDILSAQCTAGTGDWITLQTLDLSTGAFASNLYTNSGSGSAPIYPYRNNLVVGDIDEDISIELMGFSSTQDVKIDFSGGAFNISWASGSTTRFSDWTPGTTTPNYSFVRTFKYAPEQLLVFKKVGSNYSIGSYLYNRIPDCATTRQMQASPEIIETAREESSLSVYPNPSNGFVTVEMNQDAYQNAKVYVYTIQGALIKTVDLDNSVSGIQKVEFNMDIYPNGMYLVSMVNNGKRITKRISIIK